MKKILLFIVIGIIIVMLALLFIAKKRSSNVIDNNEQILISNAWVEVLSGNLFQINDPENKILLKSGDEVVEGDVLKTDEDGLVNIIFSDGSMARMDSLTQIIINKGSCSSKDGVVFKAKVVAGNLWSKIIKLTTPESVWEVNTANAVAAVRGTAFGVSFTGTSTIVLCLENEVLVQVINPFSNEIIENQSIILLPYQRVIIPMEMIDLFLSGEKNIKDLVEEVNDSFFQEKWVIKVDQSEYLEELEPVDDNVDLDVTAGRAGNLINNDSGSSNNEPADKKIDDLSQIEDEDSYQKELYSGDNFGDSNDNGDYLVDYSNNEYPDQTNETYDTTYTETDDSNENQTTSGAYDNFQYQSFTYPNYNLLQ